MALTDEQRDTLNRLTTQIMKGQQHNRRMDAYYDGEQRLEQLGLAVPPELRQFVTIVAWPGTYADAIEERITLEGFRLPGATEADDDLWSIWQANNLDEESQLGHLDAIGRRRSFIIGGAGDADTPDAPSAADGDEDRDTAMPLITVESADEVAVELSPRSRRVSAAVKTWKDGSDSYATLYEPEQTTWFERRNATWVEVDRDEHGLGVVPVVPLVAKPRLSRRGGKSLLSRVIGLTDAAARALTNAQVATEVMAIPQRYVLGASKGDFVDKDGNVLTTWEAYFGAIWALKNGDAKVGQFTAADLANFKTIVDHYASLVAGVTGLPMRYLGQVTTNPPSAEGIRADESRIIKADERLEQGFGGSWELGMRVADRIATGSWNPKLRQMETLWRDPATPTKAQAADAAVKLVQAGILPVEAAWEDLGYSAVRRQKLKKMRAEEQANDPVRAIAAGLAPPAQPDPNVPGGEGAPADAGGQPA